MRAWSRLQTVLRPDWLLLAGLLFYSRIFFFSDWIAHDEGLLGQSAERILMGQLPHLDFDEMYSGGLSYLHAGVFRLFGVGVGTLREFHWWIAAAFSILCFRIGMRLFSSRWRALALAAITTVWGPLNYPAAMPSWYVVYLATLSGALLARSEDSKQSRALTVAAGFVAGLAVWIKVTGVFAVLGLGQLLIARALPSKPKVLQLLPLLISCLCFLIFGEKLSIETVIWLCLPVLLLGFTYAVDPLSTDSTHCRRQLVWFAVGTLASAGGLLLLAIHSIGTEALWRGLWVMPKIRLTSAFMPLPDIGSYLGPVLVASAVVSLLVLLVRTLRTARAQFLLALSAITGVLVLGGWGTGYSSIWLLLRCSPIVLAMLVLGHQEARTSFQIRIWVGLALWLGLTQFPYSHGIYLVYCMPLFLVGWAAWSGSVPQLQSRYIWTGMAAVGAFAIAWVNVGNWRRFGVQFQPRRIGVEVPDPRLGIRVSEAESVALIQFIATARASVPPGAPILALPDAPEVPFLVGRPSMTRAFYEFFGSSDQSTARGYLESVDFSAVQAVVINRVPEFSRPFSKQEFEELRKDFPYVGQFGKYLLMTREPQRTP